MEAPDVELWNAISVALKTDEAVAGFVAERIYDRVPEKQGTQEPAVPHPYISQGPSTAITEDFDCVEGDEITIQIDVWSRGAGEAYSSAQCRKISAAVKRAIHNAEITLNENALVLIRHELTRIIREPDGATYHGAVQVTAIVETP